MRKQYRIRASDGGLFAFVIERRDGWFESPSFWPGWKCVRRTDLPGILRGVAEEDFEQLQPRPPFTPQYLTLESN